MNAPRKRQLAAATAIRQRRLALGRTAADIARTAGFSTSKVLRIERAPERARLGDVLLLDETLQRLERAVDPCPGSLTRQARRVAAMLRDHELPDQKPERVVWGGTPPSRGAA